MSGRIFVVIAALACLALSTGCKKKPPEETPVYEPAPAPAPKPAAEVPKEVTEMVANFSKVYFDFDQADLDGSSKAALDENAKIMAQHSDLKLELQGHADERGTTGYNLALGQRRANTVMKYLVSQGVARSRLKVVSYGEERPVDGGHYETAWSKNRRAEFAITWGDTSGVRGTTDQQ